MAVFRVRPQGFQYPVGLTEANVSTGVAEQSVTLTSSGYVDIPNGVDYVEFLGVAGGGAGGRTYAGGGGGAGALYYSSSYPVAPGQKYYFVVGAGAGGGNPSVAPGVRGSNTIIFIAAGVGNTQVQSIEIEGGGRGHWSGTSAPAASPTVYGPGGSGGGGSLYGPGPEYSPYTNRPAAGVATNLNGGVGNNGGTGSAPSGGAGGGGAGSAGNPRSVAAPPYPATNGVGGDGLEYSISGSPVIYAAGGAGSVYADVVNEGGSANTGGFGSTILGGNGTANRGSGGGGAYNIPAPSGQSSGSGADGVVIVKWSTTQSGYQIN